MKKTFLFLLFIKLSYCTFSQVNLPTGGATFSLPMFTWQEEKSRLNSVVSLNYNSGNGLKVNDVASNVGQGWNLLAGGSVTRIQAGEPDDQKPREGAVEDETKYPAGYLYDTRPYYQFSDVGCPGALPRYPLFKDQNHTYKQHNAVAVDTELDQFAFQINGRTGIFILGKHYNAGKGQMLGDSKMKIWFVQDEGLVSQGIRTTISTFYIQDENGLIYKFNKLELTKVLRTKYCNANLTSALKQPTFKHEKVYNEAAFDNTGIINPYIVNTWHLTEIKDPLTSRTITLTYIDRDISAFAGTSIANFWSSKNYCVLTHGKSITKTPVISTINYPDSHKVTFTYSTVNRIDLNGDRALASVDITYNTRIVSRYLLRTSYFILNRYGNPVSDYQKKNARLCLLSVKKIGVDLKLDEPPHIFDYYTGSGAADDVIPGPFSHLKDIWGFYNGDNGRDYFGNNTISLTKDITQLSYNELRGLCFLRDNAPFPYNAKTDRAKNGLLKQVSYPTGGTLKYEYAQNMAMFDGQYRNVGGVHVSKISSTDGGYSNGCDNPLITNYAYTAENSTESSLWGTEIPDNSIAMNSFYDPQDKYFYWKPIANMGCDFRYKYPGILSKDQATSLTTGQQIVVVVSKVLNVVSSVMQVLDVVKLCLSATPAAWTAVILDVVATVINIGITCIGDKSKNSTTVVYYNTDINGVNPLPTQFRRVEIIEGSGTSGKTVMEFTSPDDPDGHAIWEPTNVSLSKKQRYAPWAYGLTRLVIVEDAAGNVVSQTENQYDFTKAKRSLSDHGMPYYPSCKCLVTKSISQQSTDWSDPAKFNPPTTPDLTSTSENMIVDVYQYYSGRVELEFIKERIYKTGSTDYAETTTKYLYDPFTHYQVTDAVVTQSNGKQTFKHFTYSADYNPGYGIFKTLNDNNILFMPVSNATGIVSPGVSYDYFSPGSADQFILNEAVSEYTTIGNGDIKVLKTMEQRFKQPTTTWSPYGNPGTNYTETQQFFYDAAGTLTGVKSEGDRYASHIYNYFDDKLQVASVINADPVVDKVAYTSFEKFGTDESKWIGGGWTRTGGTGGFLTTFRTGLNSLSLGVTTLTAAANPAKPYILSFWSTTASVAVSGGTATLITSGPAVSGFTYYEYAIAQGASSISVSGTATIDELRLYPKTARMNTVTYDPIIGKTSECDENNRVTYYEYDELGRLRFIKDDKRNIVKMYEYNYSKKPGCGTVFTHPAITEIYKKNDCGAGFVGKEYIYIIPAGKYTSTINQEIVDMQIENELNTLGQATANAQPNACIQTWTNDAKSQSFTKQTCDVGYVGPSVAYAVPLGRYTSTISKQDANDQAQEDIDANGQANANVSPLACIASTVAVWIGTGAEQCQNSHMLKQVRDENPNSSTYNQTQWIDTGVDPTCPTVYAKMYKTDIVNGGEETTATILIKFFSDDACTVPLTVTNLSVNYKEVRTNCNGSGTPLTYNYSVTCNGTQTSLGTEITRFDDGIHCWIYTFSLNTGTDYVVK